jgi:hypothetical protein
LAFEVRPALSEFDVGEESPRAGAFTDEDWHKILTLAPPRRSGRTAPLGPQVSPTPVAGKREVAEHLRPPASH